MKKITLPAFITPQQASNFFNNILTEFDQDCKIVFPDRCTIAPFGLAVLASWGRGMKRANKKIFFEGNSNTPHIKYGSRLDNTML